MCEVISAVAHAEKETLQVRWLRRVLERVAGGSDNYIDQQKLPVTALRNMKNIVDLCTYPESPRDVRKWCS